MKRPDGKNAEKENNKPAVAAALRSRKTTAALYAASFLIPFLIFGFIFAFIGVYPFGDRQYLIYDGWQQYFPYMSDLWYRLRGEGSFMWSLLYGIGGNYLPLFAYNLASPLNLLLPFFPNGSIPELMALFTMIKLGFAGLFTAVFLKGMYKRIDILIPAFSASYALCAYTLGYYWNIMWLDTIAMLPIVVYGLYSLVKEGYFVMYTVALSVSVLFNFYLGLFVCIFAVMMFHVFYFTAAPSPGGEKRSPQSAAVKKTFFLFKENYLSRFALFALTSVLAAGIVAFLMLPAFLGLRNTSDMENPFPSSIYLFASFFDVFGNFIAFTPPTFVNGLPNLYCGMLPVMLSAVFIRSAEFKLREKAAYLAVIIFLILSCNVNVLTFIWSGFHVTNSLPYRFSFLVSFLTVAVAYSAYIRIEKPSAGDMTAMAAAAALLLICATLGAQSPKHAAAAAALSLAYIGLFALKARFRKNKTALTAVTAAVFFIMTIELAITAGMNITRENNTTDRMTFPYSYENVQNLLKMTEPEQNEFFRTEFANSQQFNQNAPAVYRYDGISVFASTTNVNTSRFLTGLGLPSWDAGNIFYYTETSPFTSVLLNHRYLISRPDGIRDDGLYWKPSGKSGDLSVFENTSFLPFGFTVGGAAADYAQDKKNPFLSQNDLFRRMTGLEGELFILMGPVNTRHKNYNVTEEDSGEYEFTLKCGEDEGVLAWDFQMPVDGLLFAYFDFNRSGEINVTKDGGLLQKTDIEKRFISMLGRFRKNEIISFSAEADTQEGRASVFAAYFDAELFAAGYEILSRNTMELTEFKETRVAGHIAAEKDGLLFTSIPYEKGWRARVDGEEAEIITVGGSMAALRLETGEHEIEFTYRSYGLPAGLLISVCSLAFFSVLIICGKQRKN
ncbi:MAG: YfhO family protein [Oscillospiraceae bacterium]|nr:YfhO family protein [Oscillospiraceae bacterium]